MTNPAGSPATPFLRWAGSKRQMAARLARFWQPSFSRYVEPFLGSGVLFFHIGPKQALLGDINAHLIEAFVRVRDNPIAVSRALARMTLGPVAYYHFRSMDPTRLSPTQRAARFIYLNRYCFNGIYRTNSKGDFNVPYGGDKSGRPPDTKHLQCCSRLLTNATLMAADFESIIDSVKVGDFVYMDPPYSLRSRRSFAEYHPDSFALADLRRLRAALLHLDRAGASFLLTYAVSTEAHALSRGFHSSIVSVRRNIAGFADHRRTAREMIISNFIPA